MNAIFASKIYRGSSRKDKIKAALPDPVNADLVKQLHEYLDDADIDAEGKLKSANPEIPEPEKTPGTPLPMEHAEADPGIASTPSATPSPSAPAIEPSGTDTDTPSTDPVDADPALEDPDANNPPDGTTQTAEASQKIRGGMNYPKEKFTEDIGVLKGTINSRGDIAGVDRIELKDDEIWMYYNDSINLNNIMDNVITFMNAGYDYMEFNRIARRKNAIVFVVTPIIQPVNPVSGNE